VTVETSSSVVPRLGASAIAGIFALAFSAQVASIAHFGFSRLSFGDARIYLWTAHELAQTGHYPRQTDPRLHLFRPPAYPFFLALVTGGSTTRIARAKIANAVLESFAALLISLLSARVFRSRAPAILTGLAAALHPAFLIVGADIQSEPLFLVLLLGAGLLQLVAADRASLSLASSAGVLLAAATLTRPSALILAPMLASHVFDTRHTTARRGRLAIFALGGFVFALAPWTVRNALVFHEPILVSDGGGLIFYAGNTPHMAEFYELRDKRELSEWIAADNQLLKDRFAAMPGAVIRSPGRRSRAFVDLAIRNLRENPRLAFRLYALKILDWLRPYPSPLSWPRAVVWSVGLLYAVLGTAAAIGLANASRKGVRLFVLVFLAMTMAIHVVTIVTWRYRTPYWDPILLLYAVAAVRQLAGNARVPSYRAG
jgi:hypothetical protein